MALTDSGLSVENGGVVEAESLSFAKTRPGFAAVDDVYVTGTGASVVVAGEAEVSVNQGMTAFVSVVNGGQFVAQRLTFGGQGGHRVVVAGEQTLLQAQEDVVFGSSGELNNDLTVRDGATLRVGGGDGTLVMNGGVCRSEAGTATR